MAINPKVNEAVEWYSKNRIIYEALAKKVESVIREILKLEGIDFYNVSGRAKTIESYEKKASREKYKNPRSEIFDMAGVRIITYTNSDAKHVRKILEEAFKFHPEHTIDKGKELGIDRMGYQSVHCVGTFKDDRLKLPENRIFKGIYFEIQIRTILQHAWAEFEHDRNYKFSGVLPQDIRRRLSTIAGSLELADREFDNILKDIDKYVADIDKRSELGDLMVPINSTSLKTFLKRRLKHLIEDGLLRPTIGADEEIIQELTAMGINTLKDLDEIIPDDYEERARKLFKAMQSEDFVEIFLMGPIRDIMMIHDVDKYFKKAWKSHWQGIHRNTLDFLKSYGVDLKEYVRVYNLEVI